MLDMYLEASGYGSDGVTERGKILNTNVGIQRNFAYEIASLSFAMTEMRLFYNSVIAPARLGREPRVCRDGDPEYFERSQRLTL